MSFSWSQYSQTMAPTTGSALPLTAGKSSHLNFFNTTPPKKSAKPMLIQRLDSVGESVPSFEEESYITSNSYRNMSTPKTDKNMNIPRFQAFPCKNNWTTPTPCQMHIPPMSQGFPMHNSQGLHTNYHFSTETAFNKQPYCQSLLGLPFMPYVHAGQMLQYLPPVGLRFDSQDILRTAAKFGPSYNQSFCPTGVVDCQPQHHQPPPAYHFSPSALSQENHHPTMKTQNSSGLNFKPTEMPMSKLDQLTQNLENLSVTSDFSTQGSSDIMPAGGVMAGHSSLTPEGESVNNNGKQVDCNIARGPGSTHLQDFDTTQSRALHTLNASVKCKSQPPTADINEQQEKQQKETAKIDISLFDEAVLASNNLPCDILLEMSDLIPKKNCEKNNTHRMPKADVKTKITPPTLSTPDFLKPKVPVSKKKARPSAKKRRRLKKQRGEILDETPKSRHQNPQKRFRTDSYTIKLNEDMPATSFHSIPTSYLQTTCVSFQISPLSSDSSDEGFDNDEDEVDWDEGAEQQWDTFSLEMFQSPLTLSSTQKMPVLIGNIKICIAPQSPEVSPQKSELAHINSKWNECYAAMSPRHHFKSTKVSFADNLTSIHEADDIERKGHWEQFAIDRCRFKQRVAEVERDIAYIFLPDHRQNVYDRLFPSQ